MPVEKEYYVTFLCTGEDTAEWRRQIGEGDADLYEDKAVDEDE